MSYEEYCNWYAVHGDPYQDHVDHEFNARFDDSRERFPSEVNLEGETYIPEIDG